MQEKHFIWLATLTAVVGIGILYGISVVSSSTTLEGPFNVTYVFDGDTIGLDNGDVVRLLDIDTPEKGACYYDEAKEALTRLVLDQPVYLERDGEDYDPYRRKLRYVYANNTLVNGNLVAQGYAKIYNYSRDTAHQEDLRFLEKKAMEQHLGVWTC